MDSPSEEPRFHTHPFNYNYLSEYSISYRSAVSLPVDIARFRRFRYLRLDGNSTITDRRNMVDAWQGASRIRG